MVVQGHISQQRLLQILAGLETMASQHVSNTSIEALDHTVGAWRSGLSQAVLDAQAAEARAQRHAAVEERIAKLPVKMLVPIGLFTLPAMLILLLAPVALQVLAGLG